MKLITLNTWGGRVGQPFVQFILDHKDTDIFCFQEIYDKAEEVMDVHYPEVDHSIFTRLKELLPKHNGFFRPVLEDVYGIAIFIKKNISVLEEGEVFIHRNERGTVIDGHHSRNLQWIKFDMEGRVFTVMNVHGLWNGKGKNDTPERIAQSNIIREFMDRTEDPKILCGDFNLNPDTESVKILEKDMKNLVKDHSITSTRTSLYEKQGKFADYIFTSPDINIKTFEVLPEEVSDHSALSLEI